MNKFYDQYWVNQRKEKIFDFYYKWPLLRHYIPKGKNILIVDFGCGNGQVLKEMLKINPKASFVGLDVSNIALEEASRELPGVAFYKITDGQAVPLTDASVDFVFSSEVVEHVFDVEKYFSEISRILRPKGQLLLTTPAHNFIKNLLIIFLKFDDHFNVTGSHIRFFSKNSLFRCLRKAGLRPLKHGYYGRFRPFPWSIFVLAEKITVYNQ